MLRALYRRRIKRQILRLGIVGGSSVDDIESLYRFVTRGPMRLWRLRLRVVRHWYQWHAIPGKTGIEAEAERLVRFLQQ